MRRGTWSRIWGSEMSMNYAHMLLLHGFLVVPERVRLRLRASTMDIEPRREQTQNRKRRVSQAVTVLCSRDSSGLGSGRYRCSSHQPLSWRIVNMPTTYRVAGGRTPTKSLSANASLQKKFSDSQLFGRVLTTVLRRCDKDCHQHMTP